MASTLFLAYLDPGLLKTLDILSKQSPFNISLGPVSGERLGTTCLRSPWERAG